MSSEPNIQTTMPNSSNPKKIPQAIFIENVEEYMGKFSYEKIMDTLQETYGYLQYQNGYLNPLKSICFSF